MLPSQQEFYLFDMVQRFQAVQGVLMRMGLIVISGLMRLAPGSCFVNMRLYFYRSEESAYRSGGSLQGFQALA